MLSKWLFRVAAKKVTISLVGYVTGLTIAFVASENLQSIISYLSTMGLDITVKINEDLFRNSMAGIGLMGFTAAHDWLKLKFPNSKYL